MSNIKKTILAASSVTIVLLISRILGFGREVFTARYFGVSMQIDAYEVASIIPLLIFNLIFLYAIALTIVPIYTEAKKNQGEQEAINFINSLAGFIMILSILILAIGITYNNYLVKIIAPGFEGQKYNLTVELNRIMLPMIFFSSMVGVGVGLLNANQKFWLANMIGIPQNILIIICTIIFTKTLGVYSLAYGSLLSVAGQLFIILPSMIKLGYRPKLRPDFNNIYFRKSLKMALPILISSAVFSSGTIVDRMMASSLPDGSIAALYYAFKLNNFVVALFVAALNIVSLQSFSVYAAESNYDGLKGAMNQNIRIILILVMPITVGLIILRVPLIKVLFYNGAFDMEAVEKTAIALGLYSIGLVSIGIRDILNSTFYALKDSKTPAINALLTVTLHIVLNTILIKQFGYAGLALATSVSATVMCLLLVRSIRKKIGGFGGSEILGTFVKSGIAAGIMGIETYSLYKILDLYFVGKIGSLLNLIITISCSGLIYFIISYLLKVKEAIQIHRFIQQKYLKVSHFISNSPNKLPLSK